MALSKFILHDFIIIAAIRILCLSPSPVTFCCPPSSFLFYQCYVVPVLWRVAVHVPVVLQMCCVVQFCVRARKTDVATCLTPDARRRHLSSEAPCTGHQASANILYGHRIALGVASHRTTEQRIPIHIRILCRIALHIIIGNIPNLFCTLQHYAA